MDKIKLLYTRLKDAYVKIKHKKILIFGVSVVCIYLIAILIENIRWNKMQIDNTWQHGLGAGMPEDRMLMNIKKVRTKEDVDRLLP